MPPPPFLRGIGALRGQQPAIMLDAATALPASQYCSSSADGDDSRFDISDAEIEDPFQAIPALRGFHLSGARQDPLVSGTLQALQLWFHARGFGTTDGWKAVN